MSLHILIEQDVHANDETSKQRLQRRLQKFVSATQISFAERALLADENRLLFKQNKEPKVRRSTKSTGVGKAKVMSYEDIGEARAKRAAKKQAKAKGRGRGKRGRKRKSLALEVDALEPKTKVAWISEAPEPARAPVAWMSEVQVAPVAWMIRDCCTKNGKLFLFFISSDWFIELSATVFLCLEKRFR
ncbi:hypothetical protein B0J14DRAFT_557548 [Halenospora varia]|nr:hypothetical protein B0J14DRAFT_557548 [Halenospora varia]